MMEDTLSRFGEQFDWQPAVEYSEALSAYKHYIVCGMGGSHLGAWLIKRYGQSGHGTTSNIFIHRDYGLPELPAGAMEDTLVILSSYSGTTEEVLDSARVALEKGLPMAAISTGGKLIEFAREQAIPHIVIPDTGLAPRMAVGFSMIGLARLMGQTELENAIRIAGKAVDPMAGREEGKRLADILLARIPLIYSSGANIPLAYMWKIKFNETAKIPAFCNALPEMCHNELCGFDTVESTESISERMVAVFLTDENDHERNQTRMQVAGEILAEHRIPVERVVLRGEGFEKVFASALLADWVTLELARSYGVPNAETPLIADFKKRIGQ